MILDFRGLQGCFRCGSRVRRLGGVRVGGWCGWRCRLKLGMPEWDPRGAAGGDRLIWASLDGTERLTLRPPARRISGGIRSSAMRASEVSRIWSRRGLAAGWVRKQAGSADSCVPWMPGVSLGGPSRDGDIAAVRSGRRTRPIIVGRGAESSVGRSARRAGDVSAVPVDHLVGVDRLVSHGGCCMSRWQATVGRCWWNDVTTRRSMTACGNRGRSVAHGAPGASLTPNRGERVVRMCAAPARTTGRFLQPRALEQQRAGLGFRRVRFCRRRHSGT